MEGAKLGTAVGASVLSALWAISVACDSTGSQTNPLMLGGQSRADGGAIPMDGSSAEDATTARGVANCPAGSGLALDRVRFFPTRGQAARMLGGVFEGSNLSPTNGFVELARIRSTPQEGVFTELRFENTQRYRYIKYYSPDGSYGAVAEVEFYHDAQRLTGRAFGSAGARNDGSGTYLDALDGNPQTSFETGVSNGNYVGLDVGQHALVSAPRFSVKGGAFDRAPVLVTLVSNTPSARIRYTVDGSNPTRDHGIEAHAAVPIPHGRTQLKAIAYSDCLFDSEVVSQIYYVGVPQPVTRGLTSYHIGNSLTDTINPWLKPIADSTGVDHTYYRWTIPGAGPSWLWTHKGDGFADPLAASQFDSFVQTAAPLDHMTVQPFADPTLDLQGGAVRDMYGEALRHSPELQLWVYAQWPWQQGYQNDGLVEGAPWNAPKSQFFPVPKSWEDAVMNQLHYHERFRAYVDEAVAGKTVLVIPAGLALIHLKQAIESGQIHGIQQFFGPEHWSDELHLSTKGAYFVSLVFYACLYRQSPEGRVTFADTGLTEVQARTYQRIAWETVRDYAWSGIGPTPAHADPP